jgi:RNA polymerase sigma factor (TIGR02999 family)
MERNSGIRCERRGILPAHSLTIRPQAMGDVTRLLHLMQRASSDAARQELFNQVVELVYGDLRRNARRIFAAERAGTLQPTALVHEAYARLARYRMGYEDRRHFVRVAACAMRRILVDRARAHNAAKRPHQRCELPGEGPPAPVENPHVILDVDRALTELSEAQVQFVELRYFLGYTIEETADNLGLKVDTAKKRWRAIKARLAQELAEQRHDHGPTRSDS